MKAIQTLGAGRVRLVGLAVIGVAAATGVAQTEPGSSLNFYGVPGLVDMPSGYSAPDAQLSVTHSTFAGIGRNTLSFQLSDRISGSFRYSRFKDLNFGGYVDYFDRSFDVRFLVLEESTYLPAVTVGLQDFMGTGLQSAEYIVASKTLGSKVSVTAGLGWGRLASYGAIGAPFGPRPVPVSVGTGGQLRFGDWFKGDVAPFAGVAYSPTEKLTLKAEYSSDNYDFEAGTKNLFDRRSPFNFGAEYRINDTFRVGAYYLYGSTIGLQANLILNPKKPLSAGVSTPAPAPVQPRDRAAAQSWGTEWVNEPGTRANLQASTSRALAKEKLLLEAMRIEGTRAVVYVRNNTYDAEPQMLGRVARTLANTLPPSVEELTIVPVVNGISTSAITVQRSDVEALENHPSGTEAMLDRAVIADHPASAAREDRLAGIYPRFSWSASPATSIGLFDPDAPLIGDIGVRLLGQYELAPGMILSGSVVQRIIGNYDKSTRVSNSVLPHVRSDANEYFKQGGTAIERLTAAYHFRPGENLYGRVTAGYLERMFGGISAELLWKPVDSRLALGAEANYVKQRAFDGGLSFQPYEVLTGHVSAYYDFGKGYEGAIHAGRYLAGDYGATFQLDRRFANGWKVGAFATFTDVSAAEFGEGSFDKGIQIEIPLSWVLGRPTQTTTSTLLRPVTRDGGARLNVEGRLYESVRDYHKQDLSSEWGMYWR